MLKKIPAIITPELLKTLNEMGHGDELVIADGNFPGPSLCKKTIRLDGQNTTEALKAILELFPLDSYEPNMILMEKDSHNSVGNPIWKEYYNIAKDGDKDFKSLTKIERLSFYERTKKAYCVIMTSDKAIYANIILRKGIV